MKREYGGSVSKAAWLAFATKRKRVAFVAIGGLLCGVATAIRVSMGVAAQENQSRPERPIAGAKATERTATEGVSSKQVSSERAALRLPGVQPGGSTLLPNQWSLQPAGKHLALGDFPVAIALHPSENMAAVLHAGYGEHEVVIVDLSKFTITSRVALSETFVGVTFSPDGRTLFASGAGQEIVHRFTYAAGYLSDRRELKIAEPKEKRVPAGLATSVDGGTLYVACPWGHTVEIVPVANSEAGAATRRQVRLQEDDYPHSPLPSRDGKRLYVSLWGRSAVAVVNPQNGELVATWMVDSHPTEMVQSADGGVLYVACANSTAVHVIDTATGKTLEVIRAALYAQADNGNTPNSLSLSPDGKVLLVANADNNNVAVIDVSDRGRSRSLGFIPVGWYPTSVRFNAKGDKIYVASGKGLSPKANRQGPRPGAEPPRTVVEYIGGLYRGSLSVIDTPSPAEMAKLTRTAFACSPLREDKRPVAERSEPNHPVPAKVGDPSPIKHCLYIIKENRTYDQVFGDMPEGNGDPALCIFPEKVTPNHHALAREFVLLDNFYVESEVSADGHEWSMAAYATDFVEKTWPLLYRGSREGKLRYPAEGAFPIARPSSGYIWDRCREAKVSYRSYGEFVSEPSKTDKVRKAKVEALEGHFDPEFHGYDLDYPDVKRADRFIEELRRFEREGAMPRLQILRLPNDHTSGTAAGKPTPTAMVADNDLALGRIVEAVSASKFWKDTAIFVVEDDAQNGSDHVDAHRTVALVISPYARRGHVDSNMYSTASMLRTMELILGLQPMTQFDAAALPMYGSFQAKIDTAPYRHRPAGVDLTARNAADAWGAKLSATFDFSKEDAADDLLLNEVVWRSVRGANSPMPAPVRASFVFASPLEDDEDEEEEEREREEREEHERERKREQR
jgi:YVTN family beta-propeller protein